MWLGLGECMARLGLSLVLVFLVSLALAVLPAVPAADAQTSMTVVASGLNTPRGLTFGPDGKLYVAEAGTGGDEPSDWVPPFRSARIGTSGRIVRIDGNDKTAIASGLQSIALGPAREVVGVDDLAFMGPTLYALVGQANPLPGGRETFSLLVKVGMDGKVETVADLGKFERENNPDQTVPDSNPFGIAIGPDGNIYVADAGGNDVLKVTPSGQISVAAVWRDNPVPTAVAFDKNGQAHATFLTGAPFPAGASRVERLTGSGTQVVTPGLTAVTDLKVGPDGMLYVLEHASEFGGGPPPSFKEKSGRVLRVTASGVEPVVTGLNFPTKMTFGPDGALYIANNSSDVPADQGQILRATFPAVGAGPGPVAQPSPAAKPAGLPPAPTPASKPSAPAQAPAPPASPAAKPAGSPAPAQAPSALPRTGVASSLSSLALPLAGVGATLVLVGIGVLRRRR